MHYFTTMLADQAVMAAIGLYLDTPSIKALRLLNHSISDLATPYLFYTLHLKLRKQSLERLYWVAQQPKFAAYVRKIVWQTAHYHDDLNVSVSHSGPVTESALLNSMKLEWSEDPDVRERQRQHVLARYYAIAAEEHELLEGDDAGDLFDRLAGAFKHLNGLESVEYVVWDQPLTTKASCMSGKRHVERSVNLWLTASSEVTDSCEYEPPPMLALDLRLFRWSHAPYRRQLHLFERTIHALRKADRRLTHFGTSFLLDEVQLQWTEELCETNESPLIAIAFGRYIQPGLGDAMEAMRHLKSLRLCFEGSHHNLVDILLGKDETRGNLRRIVSQVYALEDFDFKLHAPGVSWPGEPGEADNADRIVLRLGDLLGDVHYTSLRSLSLEGFWVEHAELCAFLEKHTETLEELTFVDLHLGGSEKATRVSDGIALAPVPANAEPESTPEWDALAQVCSRLPALRGLVVHKATAGPRGLWLRRGGERRVVAKGMAGRPNSKQGEPERMARIDKEIYDILWRRA